MWFIAGKRVHYSSRFWKGTYEEDTCRFIQTIVPQDAVCYDIGANLGYHTLIMAKSAKQGQVYAFEPIPQVCEILEKNLKINDIKNVIIVQKVISRQNGIVTLGRDIEIDQAAFRFATEVNEYLAREMIKCEAVTLDKFVCEGNLPPSFIKIDVEGAEVDVLLGGLNILRNLKPILLCETHGYNAAQGVYELLGSLNYEMFKVTSKINRIDSPQEVPNNMNEGHLLARPK
jgi:FkbM family methyltransferase